MHSVRITAIRQTVYPDLMALYENPLEHACDVREGDVWISDGWNRPDGLCESAWESMASFVRALGAGGRQFLRRMDEESPFRHDLLQRRFPPGKLLFGGFGGRCIKEADVPIWNIRFSTFKDHLSDKGILPGYITVTISSKARNWLCSGNALASSAG